MRSTMTEPWMIKVEAMRLARNAVKDAIRAQNLRLKDYEHSEITRWAERWLDQHRASLIGQATITLLFAAERNSRLMHKRSRFEKSMASAVQISGAK